MRISTKVSLSLAVLGLVVFGGLGAVQVSTEKRDLEQALVREATTLCRTAAESLRQDVVEQDLWESSALLQSVEEFERDLDVMVWRPDEPTPTVGKAVPAALLDEVGRAAVVSGEVVTRMIDLSEGQRAVIVAASIDPQREFGAIVLVRPLAAIDADVRREAQMIGLSVLVFSVLGGILGFVLGEIYIRRPLARLDQAMTVVAGGDLDASLSPGRADEIGLVLERFNHMRRELQRARLRLHAEQDAHRATREHMADLDRLVTIGQLAAGLAHEIGSPLQILHGRALKLADRLPHDQELARSAQIIVTQTERITRTVRQLLELARPHRYEVRPADPVACIRAVMDLLELEARRREVSVRLDGPSSGLVNVDVDADALQQIVLNVARNGLAALAPGGTVQIHVKVDNATTDIPKTLEVRVSDDGRGMSDEVRAHAFEPFFTTRAHEGGVGLGLAVVQSLVHAMRGSVAASARPGGGTEIVVRVPC